MLLEGWGDVDLDWSWGCHGLVACRSSGDRYRRSKLGAKSSKSGYKSQRLKEWREVRRGG